MKKETIKVNTQKAPKIRNFWTCARPVTQVVPNRKAYDRNRSKRDTREILSPDKGC